MQTWEYVRACVCLIQHLDELCTQVIVVGDILPQIQTIVPDGADDQENRHAAEQIRTALIIFFLGIEKFIADNRRDEQKPHKIRNNKIFTERNLVVDWHRYKMKIRCHCFFQPHKPWHVENDVE